MPKEIKTKQDDDKPPQEKFVEFQYAEVKDLTKQFLTLIAGTLVLSVSFADKILPLDQARPFQKSLLACCWLLLIIAFILAGLGIFINLLAGVKARGSSVFGYQCNYKRLAKCAYIALDIAGVLFTLALSLLAATGASRLLPL